ncbi:hypothetical protein D6764_01950 [Candidatus Woesearchaeota archaeon]|nr:MAG: hypothetical protein D6764_01950 [Candidatus Woesearchaeota archaeon]
MAVISFSFTNLQAQTKKPVRGKISISNGVSITSAEKADINFGDTTKAGIRFGFEYKSTYTPDIGSVVINGRLIFLHDADKVNKVLEEWDKSQKVMPDVAKEIMSTILNRCSVQALVMSRDVGLPPPIPLPKVELKPTSKKSKK